MEIEKDDYQVLDEEIKLKIEAWKQEFRNSKQVKYQLDGINYFVENKYLLESRRFYCLKEVKCLNSKDKSTNSQVYIFYYHKFAEELEFSIEELQLIKLLRFLSHQNIVKLIDVHYYRNKKDYNDMYYVLGTTNTNLSQIIRSQQELTDQNIQYIMYQILKALHFIHSAQIVHYNLSPYCIQVNLDMTLQICEFQDFKQIGSSYSIDKEFQFYSRHYRAPEKIVSKSYFTSKSDIWSAGCILSELLNRNVLFNDFNYLQQIQSQLHFCGTPCEEELQLIQNKDAIKYIKSLPLQNQVDLHQQYPNATPLSIDLLSKMLVFIQEKRFNALQCLQHQYFSSLYKESDLITLAESFNCLIKSEEDLVKYTKRDIEEMMYRESLYFHSK